MKIERPFVRFLKNGRKRTNGRWLKNDQKASVFRFFWGCPFFLELKNGRKRTLEVSLCFIKKLVSVLRLFASVWRNVKCVRPVRFI